MIRVRVCRADEVPRGEMREFRPAGLAGPVLIARLGDRYLATAAICPHEEVHLAGGELVGETIVCPGHGYEFDARSGRCTPDRKLTLATYAVSLVGDELWIELL